jgi:hypothetical protein
MDTDYSMNLYGANYAAIPANMLNDSALDQMDFGTILERGIKGAAYNAMSGMVNGAYASGQLQQPVAQVQAGGSGMSLILIGLVAYFLLK